MFFSDDIKKLSIGVEDNSEMSSSVIEDHEDVTIMEKALENEKKSECIFEVSKNCHALSLSIFNERVRADTIFL